MWLQHLRVAMPLSEETQRLVAACRPEVSSEAWSLAAVGVFRDYWGAGYPGDDSMLARWANAAGRVTHLAIQRNETPALNFILQGAFPVAPGRQGFLLSGTRAALMELLRDGDSVSLTAPASTLLRMAEVFTLLECSVRPHFALAGGLFRTALGEAITPEMVVMRSARESKSFTDVAADLTAVFGRAQQDAGLAPTIGPFRELIASVSGRYRGEVLRIDLGDFRNIVAHGDYDISTDGGLNYGFVAFARHIEPGPYSMSPDYLAEVLRRLAGLQTALVSWGNFTLLMAGRLHDLRLTQGAPASQAE